jgi:O-antigen/teichoic acid export membrane protein
VTNSIKSLAKQTALYGIGSVVGRVINFLLTPFLTTYFVPSEYAIYTEFYAYAVFVIVFITYGMETAYFKFSGENDEKKTFSTVFTALLVSTAAFLILVIPFKSSIANSVDYPGNDLLVILFAGILAIDALCAIPFARLRQQDKAVKFVVLKLVNILATLSLIFGALVIIPNEANNLIPVFKNSQIEWVFLANLAASALTLILLLSEIRKVNFKIVDKVLLKSMLIFGLPLLIAGLLGAINETLDRILLKKLLPFSAEENLRLLGVYGGCYKLAMFMTLSIQAFRMAAEPFFFKKYTETDAQATYSRIFTYFTIICTAIFLLVMLFLDELKYFVNERYHEGLVIVPILLLANMFFGFYYNLSMWYKLTKRTVWAINLSAIGALITIGLNILLIPKMGIVGAAWATFTCYVVMAFLSYFIGKKYYPINYNFTKVISYFVISLTLVALNTYFNFSNDLYLWLSRVAMILIFIATVFYFEKPLKRLTS